MTAGPICTDELQQSLAAATNYVNAARLILKGLNPGSADLALANLERAEAQLLRAGEFALSLCEHEANEASDAA